MRRTLLLVVMTAGLTALAAQPGAADVVLHNDGNPGGLRVENRGSAISLSSQIVVERIRDGAWIRTPVRMELLEKCLADDPPACVTMEAAATIRTVPWKGNTCSGQCPHSCRSNHYAGPGQFRFVVTTCDGKQRFVGPEFSMAAGDQAGDAGSR